MIIWVSHDYLTIYQSMSLLSQFASPLPITLVAIKPYAHAIATYLTCFTQNDQMIYFHYLASVARTYTFILWQKIFTIIILIPPSLKISGSSSNGSYRNTDEVWWRYGISRNCDEWKLAKTVHTLEVLVT
jgi:hypothetical protein